MKLRTGREQIEAQQLNAVRREHQNDRRFAAGGARLEARDFQKGTALTPLLHGRSFVDLVVIDEALDLHHGSIGREVKGPDLYRSELGEVAVQLGAAREHLHNRVRAGGQQWINFRSAAFCASHQTRPPSQRMRWRCRQ